MVTFLKTETYWYGSRHSLKSLWSPYLIVTWYGILTLNNFAKQTFTLSMALIRLHTEYQRPGPSSFRQDFFFFFFFLNAYRSLCKQLTFPLKRSRSTQGYHLFLFSNLIGPMTPMLHTMPRANWPFGSGEDF